MNRTWVIRGGRILDPAAGRDEIADLFIRDGIIRSPGSAPANTPVVDAAGLVVVPGLADIHAHFREPGNEEAETIESGSRAAARGGFTTVVTMPNTEPATDSPEQVHRTIARAEACGCVRVLPSGCITRGRAGRELADLAAMRKAGAAAFTDDGATVADAGLMRAAMEAAREAGAPIMDHALDPALAGRGVMHEGACSARLGLPGIPSSAEVNIVRRDITLCGNTGARVHIQHVSCAESVALLREARRRGLPVSGEATPHHLALTEDDVRPDDANFKMNPPVRTAEDREALLNAVADGTLQALATDHAPHLAAAKARGFAAAPFGVAGLETAAGVTYTLMVKSGRMSEAEWLRRWTAGPMAILGLRAPSLEEGQPADVALLDLTSEWTVRPEDFLSKSRNTPFEGRRLTGRAACTFCGGRMTWREEQEGGKGEVNSDR